MKKVSIIILLLVFIVLPLLLLGKKSIKTNIIINAPVDKVWNVLIDFDKYPEWNPFVVKVAGNIKEGNTIEVTFQTKGSKPVVFTPKIILFKEYNVLRWEGRLLMPGIFTGRHTFQVKSIGTGKTQLIQKEKFYGILVPFFSFDSTLEGFTSMNEAIKKRVENK